jgi:hypothetical protein
MISALPPKADTTLRTRYVRFVGRDRIMLPREARHATQSAGINRCNELPSAHRSISWGARPERKRFCGYLAVKCPFRVQLGSVGVLGSSLLCPNEQTSSAKPVTSERCQDRKSQFLFNQVRVPAPDHRNRRSANRPRQMIELDVLHSRAEQVGGYGKG